MQSEIAENLQRIKKRMNTNVAVVNQGLFHLFDLKAWLEIGVLSSEYSLEYSNAPSVLFAADSD